MENIRGLNLKRDKFLKLICDFYQRNFEKNSTESLNNLNNLISKFPELEKLKQIILLRLISNVKELSVLKIILDLYEHYLKNFNFPTYNKLLNEYIPVAELFFSEFSSSDYSQIYGFLKEQYEVFDILTKKLGISQYKYASLFKKNLLKIKENYSNLVGGIEYSKFIK